MVREIPSQNCKYLIQNPRQGELPAALSPAAAREVQAFHRQLPGYKPTPLVRLGHLTRSWGYTDIFVKDEGPRFGLKTPIPPTSSFRPGWERWPEPWWAI